MKCQVPLRVLSGLGLILLGACDGVVVPPDHAADALEDDGSGRVSAPESSDAGSSRTAASDGGSSRDAGTASGRDGGAGSSSEPPVASGPCSVPTDGQLEDVSRPTTVIGDGTPASCTGSAFVAAVANGGVITFDCGPDPVTIALDQTAKVFNDKQKVVIDGGGKVTLSGRGRVRILYQNTCDKAQKWTTSHCDDQEFPQLTVQNLTFVDGNDTSADQGGGAIYAYGGRLKVIRSRFFNNVCAGVGPDVGGGAIRAFAQYQQRPVYVVESTFGGAEGRGNVCSNGGALSSIGVSYKVINSRFTHNKAVGRGANPAQAGTPGGGSGGAIYNDGNTFALDLCGSTAEHNTANEGGGAIFFVSNDRTGSLRIQDSMLRDNPSGEFENYPGMFVIARSEPTIVGSTVE